MNDSWRESSTWLRRATLTNISAIEPRSAACSRAIFIVVWLTSLNAMASFPTSSCVVIGMRTRSASGASPGVAMVSTSLGSSSRTWPPRR